MIELNIAVRFRKRIKKTKVWQKYNIIMVQKAKDSNMILKWYYIYLIYFSDEENGSTFVDNKKNSKKSKNKSVTITNKDFNQKSASFLQRRLSLLTKISMKQNAQK